MWTVTVRFPSAQAATWGWVWRATGNTFSYLWQPSLWDYPDLTPLPESECGEWTVRLFSCLCNTILWDFPHHWHLPDGECVWVTGSSYSCLCHPSLWDFPNRKPLPECECGEWPVTLLDVYVTHYCEIFQIITLYLKVIVVSDL